MVVGGWRGCGMLSMVGRSACEELRPLGLAVGSRLWSHRGQVVVATLGMKEAEEKHGRI